MPSARILALTVVVRAPSTADREAGCDRQQNLPPKLSVFSPLST